MLSFSFFGVYPAFVDGAEAAIRILGEARIDEGEQRGQRGQHDTERSGPSGLSGYRSLPD
jgi:hypothetical protein